MRLAGAREAVLRFAIAPCCKGPDGAGPVAILSELNETSGPLSTPTAPHQSAKGQFSFALIAPLKEVLTTGASADPDPSSSSLRAQRVPTTFSGSRRWAARRSRWSTPWKRRRRRVEAANAAVVIE